MFFLQDNCAWSGTPDCGSKALSDLKHQYCGAIGKQANCQVSVELVVSNGLVAAPVGGRLYLPQSWAEDPERRAKAGVPPEITFATKSQIALQLIEQALADQVAPAPVLAEGLRR